MKIIKKYKLPNQTCNRCECVVRIKWKDIKRGIIGISKDTWICPLCHEFNSVKFKEEQKNEETN